MPINSGNERKTIQVAGMEEPLVQSSAGDRVIAVGFEDDAKRLAPIASQSVGNANALLA